MSYHARFHKTIKSLKGPYIISRQQSYGIGCQKWQSAYLIYGCSINRKLSSGVKLTWPNIFIVTLSAESAEKVIKITEGKMMQNCLNYQWTLPTYFFFCLSRLKLYNCNYSKQYEHRVRWRDALIRTDKAVWQHLTLHLSLLFFTSLLSLTQWVQNFYSVQIG